jgi:hypothetical protein
MNDFYEKTARGEIDPETVDIGDTVKKSAA